MENPRTPHHDTKKKKKKKAPSTTTKKKGNRSCPPPPTHASWRRLRKYPAVLVSVPGDSYTIFQCYYSYTIFQCYYSYTIFQWYYSSTAMGCGTYFFFLRSGSRGGCCARWVESVLYLRAACTRPPLSVWKCWRDVRLVAFVFLLMFVVVSIESQGCTACCFFFLVWFWSRLIEVYFC